MSRGVTNILGLTYNLMSKNFNLVHQSLECGELITVDVWCLENADQRTTMQKVGLKLHVAEIDTASAVAT